MKSVILIATIFLAPALSQAAIYQCVVDGKTEFSDQPCGDTSKKIEHKAAPMVGGSVSGSGTDKFLEHRASKRKIELIDREISSLQNRRERVRLTMDAALAEYRSDRLRANNNLAGAVWENSLAADAQVMRERDQSEIDQINRDIERLRENRNKIVESQE